MKKENIKWSFPHEGDEKMQVPFGTITVNETSRKLLIEAFDTAMLTTGTLVKRFEEEYRQKYDAPFAIATSNGSAACNLSVSALYDLGATFGDEVIVPALTFPATAHAVVQAGLRPVFVEVEKDGLNIDPDMIVDKITPKTKAIMAVHLMGIPAEMDKIIKIAKEHDLRIIEDACEAQGAEYKGKYAGNIGDFGATSFYAAHILCSMEGGMVTTANEDMVGVLKSLRVYGRNVDKPNFVFDFDRIGYNAKMNEAEAAVALGYMADLDNIFDTRRKNLLYLISEFKKRFSDTFDIFEERDHEKIAPHAFPFLLKEGLNFSRDDFAGFLHKEGVGNRTLFGSLPTQFKAYAFTGHKLGDFPRAEHVGLTGIHVGVHQNLNREHLDYVISKTEEFLAKQ